jgi:hypothetical protein
MASIGPMPMISGGTPREAKLTKRASGFRSNCLTAFSEARISAPAPSLVCELLPAVTLPLAANTGAACPGLPGWCRGGALVQADGAGAVADLAGGQIGHALDDVHRADLVGELAGLLGLDGALVRGQREGVLVFAADLPRSATFSAVRPMP